MEKEFNLSEKILEKDNRYYLDIAWIKEFIQRLKDETERIETIDLEAFLNFHSIINKLAGNKLVEEKKK